MKNSFRMPMWKLISLSFLSICIKCLELMVSVNMLAMLFKNCIQEISDSQLYRFISCDQVIHHTRELRGRTIAHHVFGNAEDDFKLKMHGFNIKISKPIKSILKKHF
jgi:hypothetical protein